MHAGASSSPGKAGLKAWWNQFTAAQKFKKGPESQQEPEREPEPAHTVFGVPLKESLRYASVQISTANPKGEMYTWGNIPVVIAKCGLYLKENATEIAGTFRISGSSRRMRDLQALFEAPPRYGKSIDWKKERFTTHDVASVFGRYLTSMPEPVIPHNLYYRFREVRAKKPYNQDAVIATYRQLIRSMPPPNQYLLLYVLDLLSVFARRSEQNLMTAANLAVVFQPGLLSHPDHALSPDDHRLSQQVLEFLIEHQDWFMLDITPLSAPPPTPHAESSAPITAQGAVKGHKVELGGDDGGSTVTDGWKLVEPPPSRKVTLDLPEPTSAISTEGGVLSPVGEVSDTPDDSQGSVRRRRTVPSGSTPRSGTRVLRKTRRASSHSKFPSDPAGGFASS